MSTNRRRFFQLPTDHGIQANMFVLQHTDYFYRTGQGAWLLMTTEETAETANFNTVALADKFLDPVLKEWAEAIKPQLKNVIVKDLVKALVPVDYVFDPYDQLKNRDVWPVSDPVYMSAFATEKMWAIYIPQNSMGTAHAIHDSWALTHDPSASSMSGDYRFWSFFFSTDGSKAVIPVARCWKDLSRAGISIKRLSDAPWYDRTTQTLNSAQSHSMFVGNDPVLAAGGNAHQYSGVAAIDWDNQFSEGAYAGYRWFVQRWLNRTATHPHKSFVTKVCRTLRAKSEGKHIGELDAFALGAIDDAVPVRSAKKGWNSLLLMLAKCYPDFGAKVRAMNAKYVGNVRLSARTIAQLPVVQAADFYARDVVAEQKAAMNNDGNICYALRVDISPSISPSGNDIISTSVTLGDDYADVSRMARNAASEGTVGRYHWHAAWGAFNDLLLDADRTTSDTSNEQSAYVPRWTVSFNDTAVVLCTSDYVYGKQAGNTRTHNLVGTWYSKFPLPTKCVILSSAKFVARSWSNKRRTRDDMKLNTFCVGEIK